MSKTNFSPEDIKQMRLDPILAAKVILDMDFPPHERIRINGRKLEDGTRQGGLWWSKWFLDHSGRDTAKTHNNALTTALRCCLFPNRKAIILSHKYPAVEEGYFATYFEKWNDEKTVFKAQIKKIIHKSDLIKCVFKNGSEILGLPPGLLRECLGVRGARANDLIIDEWCHFPNQELISKVMIPIATRENIWVKNADNIGNQLRLAGQNHIIFTSTPPYKFDPAYTRIKYFDRQKIQNPQNYDWQTWNYTDIPENWNWIIDREVFEDAKENLPKAIFQMEWLGECAEIGESFYNPELLQLIRNNEDGIRIKLKGDKDKYYVFGIDVAGPEGRSDFTIAIIEIDLTTEIDKLVCLIRKRKLDLDEASGIVHQMEKRFFPTIIMTDPYGGGKFLSKKVAKKKQFVGNEEMDCMPILESTEWGEGKPILYFFSAQNELVKKLLGEYDDMIINIAHNRLQSAIEKRHLLVPSESLETTSKEEEEILENINLAFKELVGIQLLKGKDGVPQKTGRGYYTFLGHKCSAYAVVYAKVAAMLFRKLQEKDNDEDEENKYVTMSAMTEEDTSSVGYF